MSWEQAVAEGKDTLVVMAEIQRRQAEVRKLRPQELDAAREQLRRIKEIHDARMPSIDRKLDEAADKRNGIIGWLDGFTRGQQN